MRKFASRIEAGALLCTTGCALFVRALKYSGSYSGKLGDGYSFGVSGSKQLALLRCTTILAIVNSLSMLALSAASSHAAPANVVLTPAEIARIAPSKLRGICNDVYGKIEDRTNPGEWSYAYERKIYEAAGVDFKKDTAERARAKIREMWNANQVSLQCDRGDFDVSKGSVLKYAVAKRTFNFIDDAASLWGIPLNVPDEADGATLLDYVDQKIRESLGSDIELVLRGYRDKLIGYGAKHCRELPDTSICK